MYHKWVSIIIIGLWRVLGLSAEVFGQSTTLCSNGLSYEGGGCCGDGVVNGGSLGGEECDYKALNTSVTNSEARWGSVVCRADCSIDTSAGSAGWSTQSCGGAGAGFKYKIEYNLFCNSDSNRLSRILYDYNTDQPIPFRVLNSLGQLEYNTLYNSCGFGEPYYTAMCGNCPCWNGSACIACPTTNSCSAPDSCGTPGACFAPTTCCDGSSQCNAGSCPTDNNGAAAGCGGGSFPCTNLPTYAVACNNTVPTSTTAYQMVAQSACDATACRAYCPAPSIYVGGVCEYPSYKLLTCNGESGNRVDNNASCPSYLYTPGVDSYIGGQSICINTADVPDHSSCKQNDIGCGVTPATCDPTSTPITNDNGLTGPGHTRTWNCGIAACSYRYPAGPQPGVCLNGSLYACSYGTSIDNSSTTWRCQGTNGGATVDCGTTSPTASCGDGAVNQAREECDSGGNNTNQCNSGSSVCSTSCAVINSCCTTINNYSCDNITIRRISGTRADCSTFNEVDPVRPWNTCCQGGSWITSPSAGADNNPNLGNPTDFACYGNTLTWNANAGAREGYDSYSLSIAQGLNGCDGSFSQLEILRWLGCEANGHLKNKTPNADELVKRMNIESLAKTRYRRTPVRRGQLGTTYSPFKTSPTDGLTSRGKIH